MIKVTEGIHVKQMIYYVELSDGSTGMIDFAPLADKHPEFKQIITEDKGVNFYLDGYTFEWYNGADIAPEWIKSHLVTLH